MDAVSPFVQVVMAALLLMGAGGLIVFSTVHAIRNSGEDRLRQRLALLLPETEEEETVVSALEKKRHGTERGLKAHLYAAIRAIVGRAGGWPVIRVSLPVASGAGIVTAIIANWIFLSGVTLAAVIGLCVTAFLLRRSIASRERKRKAKFLAVLPQAIELIVRAVQAGIPVTEAMSVAGGEIPDPVGAEFRDIAHKIQLGVDFKAALTETADNVDILDFDCFVVSLIVQRETGGQLSETLQSLATIIRRREETRDKAKALTAEGRMTANFVGALPLVISALLSIMNPKYMSVMILDPTGRTMLLIATGCVVVGMLVIGRITQAEL